MQKNEDDDDQSNIIDDDNNGYKYEDDFEKLEELLHQDLIGLFKPKFKNYKDEESNNNDDDDDEYDDKKLFLNKTK